MKTQGIDPLEALCREVKPRLAFSATTREAFEEWRETLYAKVRKISGLDRMSAWACEPDVQEGEIEDLASHTRQHLLLQTAPDYWMPLYVLRPKGEGPFVPLIALHGHGSGMNDVVGIALNEGSGDRIKRLNYDYARQAVERGYLVFAPDKRGFGSRAVEPSEGASKSCTFLAKTALILGMGLISIHTWDNMRLLDYVETRDDARDGAIGCIGLSGGGGGTLWLAAMDRRIGCAVISGHLSVYENGKFACLCNAVPDLLAWAERSDLAGLIAPRSLLVESASEDECYSRDRTVRSYEALARIYDIAGAPDRLGIDLFEGHHEWSGRKAWDWLGKWL